MMIAIAPAVETALFLILASMLSAGVVVAMIGQARLALGLERAERLSDEEDADRPQRQREKLDAAVRLLVERNRQRLAADLARGDQEGRLMEHERAERRQRRLRQVYMAFLDAGWLPPADSPWRAMAEERIARRGRAATQIMFPAEVVA